MLLDLPQISVTIPLRNPFCNHGEHRTSFERELVFRENYFGEKIKVFKFQETVASVYQLV